MSYLVLARKYRPRTFEQMVGQEHVVQALSNALTQQRLHHAYLFTGTRGVGKTTVSRILAKSLNCVGADGQGGITAAPCGTCQACRDIDAGRFVDYVELDAASNRGVEEISQLLDQAVYKPVVGRFKVYMIDEVHMLSNTAFNAMLKTLEEPPEYLKFVLATTDPQKVPVTVLSRCLQFNLRPMAPETVLEHLESVLQAEQIAADAGALRLLSRAARGSMRDALSLTDQAIAFGSGELREAGVRQMLGAVDRSHVYRLIEALAAGDGAAVVDTARQLRAQGLSAQGALEEMAVLLQQLAVLQVVPDAADAGDPEAERLARLGELLPADETQLLYSIALHGRNELGLAPDEYSGLTMVLLRMLAFKPAVGGGGGGRPASSAPLQRPAQNAALRVAMRSNEPSAEAAAPGAEASLALGQPGTPAARLDGPAAAGAGLAAQPETRPAQSALSAAAAAAQPAGPPALQPSENAPVASAGPAHKPLAAPPVAPARPVALRQSGTAPVRSIQPPAGASAEPPPWEDLPEDPAPAAATTRHIGPAPAPADPRPLQVEAEPAPASGGPARAEPAVLDVAPPAFVQQQPASVAAPIAVPAAADSPIGERWHALVLQMAERELISALVRELAMQAECCAMADGEAPWQLRVERNTLAAEATRAKLEAALAEVLGRPVRLQLEVAPTQDTPARREAAKRAARQRQAEEAIQGDPLVRSLMQQFSTARIVPGSIRPV